MQKGPLQRPFFGSDGLLASSGTDVSELPPARQQKSQKQQDRGIGNTELVKQQNSGCGGKQQDSCG